MIYVIIVFTTFSFFFLLCLWFFSLPQVKKEKKERKLIERALYNFEGTDSTIAAAQVMISDIPFINNTLGKVPAIQDLALRMQSAGIDVSFFTLVLVSVLSTSIIYELLRQVGTPIFVSLVLAVISGLLPIVYVRVKMNIRRNKFEQHFVNALTIIKNALKAGQGLTAALKIVSEDAAWPVNTEFKRVLSEVEHGMSFESALDRMEKRIALAELSFFISTIKIQRQAGGNLAEIVENIENTIRVRFELKREAATLSAQGRMSGGVLVSVPIVLVLVLNVMNPGYLLPLIENAIGIRVLIAGVIFGIIGVFWIYRIVNIRL